MRARRPWRSLRASAVTVAVLFAGAVGGVTGGAIAAGPAAAAVTAISTNPALYPTFNPGVSDYVVRCTQTTAVRVTVTATAGTTVHVDGKVPAGGAVQVPLRYGQSFTIEATSAGMTQDYFVRCLPAGFPPWTSQRPGTPQAEYYLVAPSLGFGASRWVIIFDTHGVPIWWMAPAANLPLDAKLVQNGSSTDVLWTDMQASNVNVGPAAEEHSLDGRTSRTVHIVSPAGGPTYNLNPHEVQLLGNGDDLLIGDYPRPGVDLSPIGGSTSATILDDVVQEVTPAGAAVWTWDAYDHVGIAEVDPQWRSTAIAGTAAHDVFHINSATTDGAGNLLVSLRYTDAAFFVDNPAGTTNAGRVVWKLGGVAAQKDGGQVLTISDSGCSGTCFGGQHYARFFDAGDGKQYVSLHDNGTNRGRSPRAVRYLIDPLAGIATRVEQVTDPAIRSASCCGSAKRLPGGDWVASWGANPLVAEYTPAGARVFSITFNGPYSYRTDPVLPGVLTRPALRAAMNTMSPR